MTRAELLPLIKTLLGTYPNNGVTDVRSLVDAWELMFGEEDAETVYKACRVHMNTSKWFPKPSEIKARLGLASLMYENSPITAPQIESGNEADWSTGCDICPYRGDMCIGYDVCEI